MGCSYLQRSCSHWPSKPLEVQVVVAAASRRCVADHDGLRAILREDTARDLGTRIVGAYDLADLGAVRCMDAHQRAHVASSDCNAEQVDLPAGAGERDTVHLSSRADRAGHRRTRRNAARTWFKGIWGGGMGHMGERCDAS